MANQVPNVFREALSSLRITPLKTNVGEEGGQVMPSPQTRTGSAITILKVTRLQTAVSKNYLRANGPDPMSIHGRSVADSARQISSGQNTLCQRPSLSLSSMPLISIFTS